MTAGAVLAVLYAGVLLALFAFGANGYVLLWRRRRYVVPERPTPRCWPDVLVQIPVYRERDVAARAVLAAGRLRYPGRFVVQVLDDSDDDTVERVAQAIATLQAEGVTAEHVRREGRAGFKAGALAVGLTRSDAPLVAIFDADFLPPVDFLERAVPVLEDPAVACVQGRWDHLNRDDSALTRAQALGIDVHFAIEQRARAAAGWPVSFNGSAGLWRRAALEDAGGWSADTLTEDLDLAYRAALRGWRIAYADDLPCPGELPPNLAAFKAQQRRWARGSTQVARKLLWPLWRSGLPLGAKVQATLHLLHYCVHPLLLLSAALALPVCLLARPTDALWSVLAPLAMATGGPLAMAVRAGRDRGARGRAIARDAASMMVLGVGLALSNTVAVAAALGRRQGVFERTPKGGLHSSYRLGREVLGPFEVLAGVACLLLGAFNVSRGLPSLVPFLFLYGIGLCIVGLSSLLPLPASPPNLNPGRVAGGSPASPPNLNPGRVAAVAGGSTEVEPRIIFAAGGAELKDLRVRRGAD